MSVRVLRSGADEGVDRLVLIPGFHQIGADPRQRRQPLGKGAPAELGDLVRPARRMGGEPNLPRMSVRWIEGDPRPVVAKGRGRRFLHRGRRRRRSGAGAVARPAAHDPSMGELLALWSGEAVLVASRLETPGGGRFDVTPFIPALANYRGLPGPPEAAAVVGGPVRLPGARRRRTARTVREPSRPEARGGRGGGPSATRADVLRKDEQKRQLQALTAPVGGIVQAVSVTTLGEVALTGKALITVVPNGEAPVVEALVLSEGAGFVCASGHAVIKLEAYPFTRYGAVEGEVCRSRRTPWLRGEGG